MWWYCYISTDNNSGNMVSLKMDNEIFISKEVRGIGRCLSGVRTTWKTWSLKYIEKEIIYNFTFRILKYTYKTTENSQDNIFILQMHNEAHIQYRFVKESRNRTVLLNAFTTTIIIIKKIFWYGMSWIKIRKSTGFFSYYRSMWNNLAVFFFL